MSNTTSHAADVVQITGPLLLGNLFNWGLFGALSVQTYAYYSSNSIDKGIPRAKIFAGLIFILELLQTVLATKDAFDYFGYNFGQTETLNKVGILWFSGPMMTGLVSCAIQFFYSWRIWIMSSSIYVPAFICVLSLVQGSSGIWAGAQSKRLQVWTLIQHANKGATIVWLTGTATCDVIITVAMLYYLSTSRNGFRATNAILVKLIQLTIETGLITSILAILELAFFLTFHNATYHVPAICLSKFYANSLLSLLNGRLRILNGKNMCQCDTRNEPKPRPSTTLNWRPENSGQSMNTYHLANMPTSKDATVNISVTRDTEMTLDSIAKTNSSTFV